MDSISSTEVLEKNKAVSSAYKVTLQCWTTEGMSLMNIIKSRGPRMDPWGTPTSI